jgi:hypothetical protein
LNYTTFIRTVRALADGEAAFFAAIEAAPDFDGERCAEALASNKLVDWVAPAILRGPARRRFPEAFVAGLPAYIEDRREKHGILRAQSAELHAAFERASVPFLYLKGYAYLDRLYGGDAGRRWQRDVDVLVRPAHREAATAALLDVGYEAEPGRIGEGAVRQGFLRGWANVDLHWNLRRRSRRHLGEDALWAETAAFTLEGRTYRTLSDDYTLTFALMGMVGDLRRGACQSRHFLDLYLLLRALRDDITWDDFFARREPEALAKPCLNVLALLLSVWEVAPEFPGLARAIDARRRLVELRDRREALHVVQQPRGDGVNQLWFRRVYPYDTLADWSRRMSVDLPRTLARLGPGRSFRLHEG